MTRHATRLETLSVTVPEAAVPGYEAALATVCATTGLFRDDSTGLWRVEGVKDASDGQAALADALALAAAATGTDAVLARAPTEAEGWLARTYESFPEQAIGRRLAVRGTHLAGPTSPGRITLTLDAGLAFGSGEHGSTRGCLRALERVAPRLARRKAALRVLDLGTGSGILAMAAARLLGARVLATDIEPWSVRVAAGNVALNRLAGRVRVRLADGWANRAVRAAAPYDLVLANILARPLAMMAHDLAAALAPGGTVILSGLLGSQARFVLAAHRAQGLILRDATADGAWTTLVLMRRPG